ncbi:MAG: NUDIX domain-containing protein [Planctomycetes bacterium]|nr:NUDIX domain-containing protein [Planctomycetota bacterium]
MSLPTSEPRRRGAVAVVLRQGRLLVIRRSPFVVAPGALCFPGGGIEAGESESEALVREVREELGATVLPLACVWKSVTTWNVEIAWWRAELDAESELTPNPAEVASTHWLTPRELVTREDLLESNRQFLTAIATRKIVAEGLILPHPSEDGSDD